jgi:hypothetical protein
LHRETEKRNWHRAQEWNPIIDKLQPHIDAFIDGLVGKLCIPEKLSEKIKPVLYLDIVRICLEWEYYDIVRPPFSIPMLDPWYASGHLPCGWDGEEFPEGWEGIIPQGKLMVF